jgi:DNA-binding protein HU-beta
MTKKVKRQKRQRSMTQSAMFTELSERLEMPKKQVKEVVTTLIELVYEEAPKAGIMIPGLGKLLIVDRKARMARNPQTGEQIKVPARKALKFRIAGIARRTLAPKPKTSKVKSKKRKSKR